MSPAQRSLYFREFAAVLRVRMAGRETFTKHEEDQLRHELTVEALGADVSSKDFTNAQLDAVLARFRAITQPGNLQAQLDALDGAKKRLIFGIGRTARKLVGAERAEDYVAGLVREMHRGARRPLKHARLDLLDEDDLEKVRIALAKQAERGATVKASAVLARNYEAREVEGAHPF